MGKEYREKNKEKIKKRNAEYYIRNKERIDRRNKEYNERNKEDLLIKSKEHYEKNKEDLLVKSKEYYEKNKDKHYESTKIWREKHRKEFLEYRRLKTKEDRINRPYYYAWRDMLKRTFKRIGKKKEGHTIDILGYSSIDLKNHIENRFLSGMCWSNYGEWEIDHIKEICTFDNNTSHNVINSLDNLQPLWKSDNLKKWYKLRDKIKHE